MSKRYTVGMFAKAIPSSGGIISTIAKRVGCSWDTARKKIDNSPVLLQMYNNERETLLDLAESTIVKSIQQGDTQDAKWLLSRLGKGRGYGDKLELEQVSETVYKVELMNADSAD